MSLNILCEQISTHCYKVIEFIPYLFLLLTNKHRVKNEWYEVSFVKTHEISWSKLAAAITGGGTRDSTSELSTALNVIMKVRNSSLYLLSSKAYSSNLRDNFSHLE